MWGQPTSWWARAFTLFGLFGLGIAQPLLDLYGSNPEVFIANRSSTTQIVAFALIVTLVPPLLALGVIAIAQAISESAGRVAMTLFLALGGFLAASAVLRHLLPDSDAALLLAGSATAGLVWLTGRSAGVRTWLQLLAGLPVVALVSFFAFSESAELVWESEASADESTVVGDPAPVVMLVFDELPLISLITPEGDINADLFPNFARLADQSHWFRNGISNSIATTDSVPLALTGVLNEDASPTSRDHPRNLFTLLGATYDFDVRESITTLCPESLCADGEDGAGEGESGGQFALTDGSFRSLMTDAVVVHAHATMPPVVRDRFPAIDSQWGGFAGQTRTTDDSEITDLEASLPLPPPDERRTWVDQMLSLIDDFDGSARTSMHYAHVVAPHIPWQVNPSGTRYDRPEALSTSVTGVENGFWLDDPRMATQGYQRHLMQLGFVDLLLGLMIDELERTGMWDESVIVVLADHGGSFDPGDHRRWTTPTNLDELYRVPFFIHEPGQDDGEIHDERAYLYDIPPTVVDLLDIETDWAFDGQSLLADDVPPDRPHEFDHFTAHEAPLESDLEDLFAEAEETRQYLPDQTSWPGVAVTRPYADRIGQLLSDLDPIADDRLVATIDQAAQAAAIDLSTGVVPTVLTGRITLPEELAGPDVLVSVNGTVAGAGFTVRDAGDVFTFSALVPEAVYNLGSNDVQILAPGPDGRMHVAESGTVQT
ncbi:MAG: sulfatase-like hydrolase/transferase, partial [Acidimicrobiales bacterium]